MLEVRLARKDEAKAVCLFYESHIDAVQRAEYTPRWKKNSYPSDAYLKEAVENQELYIGMEDGQIVSAMILNHKCNESYEKAKWPVERATEEILVVHTLAVHLDFCRRGIAGKMLTKAVEVGKEKKCTAIRLDTLYLNHPATNLYLKFGFQCVDEVPMYYEDTGWMNFKLFEYSLEHS
ncbi:MAG: GNAT family N-acetyltransferase [Lachnospiraceae bacterium]